ncbi:unnamed protein product [Euphydryas editha]|uniref:Uncharacterized protein n=1 Tax=Euphydryas editha TaxID=104508 RepID=A0AAU9U5N4_EUPED|nr:unnamed protein product [Euphydryas editha]
MTRRRPPLPPAPLANVFIHRPDTIIICCQRWFCSHSDNRSDDIRALANVKAFAIRARSRLSLAASPYALAGHDISSPFTMKTTPAPRRPAPTRTIRGASMQQVRKQFLSCCDAQLNMDVIEKRVSGNERVHNWWAVEGPE